MKTLTSPHHRHSSRAPEQGLRCRDLSTVSVHWLVSSFQTSLRNLGRGGDLEIPEKVQKDMLKLDHHSPRAGSLRFAKHSKEISEGGQVDLKPQQGGQHARSGPDIFPKGQLTPRHRPLQPY